MVADWSPKPMPTGFDSLAPRHRMFYMKEKTKAEHGEELLMHIKRSAEDVIRLVDKTNRPNEFLIQDLAALIMHMREDILSIILKKLFR